jgi:DNA-binding NarL/FixJ family response regulator
VNPRTLPRIVALTPAERRVLEAFLTDGCDNATLARRLGCAHETVKSHLRAVLRATGCPDRAALAVALLRGRVAIRTRPTHRPERQERSA